MATVKPVLVLDRDDVLVLLCMLGAEEDVSFERADYVRFRKQDGLKLINQLQDIARCNDE